MVDPVSLAVSVAMTAANMALTASQKIEGPRLDSTKFTGGDYGAPLQMIWGKRRLECSIFWAEDLKEVKRRRKTKGGKYNEYTYYGTWAVALAGHQITAVTRVWFDTHLVFDITGAGPVTPFDFGDTGDLKFRLVASFSVPQPILNRYLGQRFFDGHVSAYYGSDDQEPDPRMQATIEAKHGEGSCPAYRGTSYLLFQDIPLEKLGNRIPQVSVEVVTSLDTHFPFDPRPGLGPASLILAFSTDHSLLYMADIGAFGPVNYSITDVAARTRMVGGAMPSGVRIYDVDGNGELWGIGPGLIPGNFLLKFPADGLGAGLIMGNALTWGGFSQDGSDLFAFDYKGAPFIGVAPIIGRANVLYYDGIVITLDSVDITGIHWCPNYWAQDTDGEIWAGGVEQGGSVTDAFNLYSPTTGRTLIVTMPTSYTAGGVRTVPFRHFADSTHDHFIVNWNGDLVFIDRATGVVTNHVTSFGDAPYTAWKDCSAFAATWFQYESLAQFAEYSSVDGSLIRVLELHDWDATANHGTGIYDPINHAWIGFSGGDAVWYYLDRVSGDGVTLGSIASDVADMVGVEDYDFTGLDQIVKGWSATQGQASNMLEPLFDAFDSDIAPHDFQIRGTKRTGVSSGTILTERFAKDGNSRYTVTMRQAAELPKALTYNFADVAADQQPNNTRVSRPLDATDARDERTIDMTTLASSADEMRGLADRHFRRLWNSRKEATLSLTSQYLALEPSDLKTLDFDGEQATFKCVKATIRANGIIATEWVYDHASLALTDGAAGAAFDGRNPSIIVVPMLSKGFVLDIPLIEDADNSVNPQIYSLAAPYAAGSWPGATIYEAIDGEYSEELVSIPSSAPATWGYVTEDLPYANPNLWDRGNELTVTLQTGTLTGTTEAMIDASPMTNLAAIGGPGRWEIVNFTVATLTAPLTYTVSGFKRGRRGTEWAGELHGAGDQFVLLETAQDSDLGLSEVGTDLSFKAITSGRTAAGAFPINVEPFTGASLKPYAPCHLEAVKEVSGDWTLTWVRRTRVGGAWTGGTSIPLAEASEEYEVDILDSLGAVVRTISGLTSPTATYEAADQITDGGDVAIGDLSFAVYQISDAVDRGFAAEATA